MAKRTHRRSGTQRDMSKCLHNELAGRHYRSADAQHRALGAAVRKCKKRVG